MSTNLVTEKEFYKNGKPDKNPGRKPFWTSAYLDEAGKGLDPAKVKLDPVLLLWAKSDG
jgi:hypothetical protein